MRKQTVTLEIIYDPARQSRPSTWEWDWVIDCQPHQVQVVAGSTVEELNEKEKAIPSD